MLHTPIAAAPKDVALHGECGSDRGRTAAGSSRSRGRVSSEQIPMLDIWQLAPELSVALMAST
jgi:hypothetical protein